jgi:hypothetical protein
MSLISVEELDLGGNILFRVLYAMLNHEDDPKSTERAREIHRWFEQRKDVLQKVFAEREFAVLDIAHKCYRDNDRLPPNFEAFRKYATNYGWKESGTAHYEGPNGIGELVRTCGETLDHFAKLGTTRNDVDPLLQARWMEVRHKRLLQTLDKAREIATKTYKPPTAKDPDLQGFDDAFNYLKQSIHEMPVKLTDVEEDPRPVNLACWDVATNLIASLDKTGRKRVKTGFKVIDHDVAVGPDGAKFVGILGGSNHRKSGFLLSLVYNMARDGQKILLVTRESSKENVMRKLIFYHSKTVNETSVGALSDWELGRVSKNDTEKHKRLQWVADRFFADGRITGEIHVVEYATWDEIVARLDSEEDKFDVVAIDYIAHLEVPPNPRDPHAETTKLFDKAQALSRGDENHKGYIVITPLQANRAGMKAAAEREGDDAYTFPPGEASSIEWYSRAYQNMDLIVGIYNVPALGMVKIGCVKHRDGKYFDPHWLQVDPRTQLIEDLPSGTEVTMPTKEEVKVKPKPEADEAKRRGKEHRERLQREKEEREKQRAVYEEWVLKRGEAYD